MHKHWVCTCGDVVHGVSDDQIVKAAQEHMRRVHRKEVSREEGLDGRAGAPALGSRRGRIMSDPDLVAKYNYDEFARNAP